TAHHSHQRRGPVQISAAGGSGSGSHGSSTMTDNHRTIARRPAATAAAAAIVSAATSHHGDGRTPMRDAPRASVMASAPKDTQSANAPHKIAASIGKDSRLAVIRTACYHTSFLQLAVRDPSQPPSRRRSAERERRRDVLGQSHWTIHSIRDRAHLSRAANRRVNERPAGSRHLLVTDRHRWHFTVDDDVLAIEWRLVSDRIDIDHLSRG